MNEDILFMIVSILLLGTLFIVSVLTIVFGMYPIMKHKLAKKGFYSVIIGIIMLIIAYWIIIKMGLIEILTTP